MILWEMPTLIVSNPSSVASHAKPAQKIPKAEFTVAGCACINRLQIVNAGPIADNVRPGSGLMRQRKTRLNTTQGRHRLRYRVGNRTSPAIFQFQEPLLESFSRHKSSAHCNCRGY